MIHFKIITPERIVVEEEIYQVTLPIEGGEITVLPEHIPYIGTLRAGEILFRKTSKSEESSLAVSSGFVEFHNNEMIILADTAEHAEEIDLARAEEARKRAEELKKEHLEMGGEEYARTMALLEKEMARVRVARRHHSRRNGTSLPSSE